MSDLFTEQFERVLDLLPATDPWPMLAKSGFLDLLRSEVEGGAGAGLTELFAIAVTVGRRVNAPPIIETILARMVSPEACNVPDAETALVAGGLDCSQARALAAACAAAQMTGAMERMLEITLDYAKSRTQFGREIGRFQAVQHQIAVAAEEVMAARMAAQLACSGRPLEVCVFAAGIAKGRVGQAAIRVGPIAHAVLGAIGVAEEHELHHHTRTLHQLRLRHGGETWWMRKVGALAIASNEDCVTLARRLKG